MTMTVYLAVNTVNGHEYIGITSRGLAARRREQSGGMQYRFTTGGLRFAYAGAP